MFVVFLRFVDKSRAAELMQGHNAWIQRGLDDGVFLMVGGLEPKRGGALIAHNTSLADLETRVGSDPFVAGRVVNAEILEITPAKADPRVAFLLS